MTDVLRLQPLRIPAGWLVNWNSLLELDPADAEGGGFGGSSLFMATHEPRRFQVDVEWRPEFDPEGSYRMRIEYAPWERNERGRRRKDVPLHFRDAETVHEFETRSREALVNELERWLMKCAGWAKEG